MNDDTIVFFKKKLINLGWGNPTQAASLHEHRDDGVGFWSDLPSNHEYMDHKKSWQPWISPKIKNVRIIKKVSKKYI
jgi:hypothetical protein